MTGMAREIEDPVELDAVSPERIPRWAAGVDGRVVAVSTDLVTGRRLAPVPPGDDAG